MKVYIDSDKHFFSTYNFSDSLDLLDTVIDIYALIVLKGTLTPKEKTVLRCYLKSGYTDEIKRAVRLDMKMSAEHLNQINFQLKQKGFLEQHTNNIRLKKVSKELNDLKNKFLKSGGAEYYTIRFMKK